jgi:hypothetical protein
MITPNKLFNLWDMLRQYAVISSWLNSGLQKEEEKLFDDGIVETRGLLGLFGPVRPAYVSQADKDRIERYLSEAEQLASDLELDAAHVTARQIRRGFESDGYRKSLLVEHLNELRGRLHDQLASRQFVHVKPRYVEFYQQNDLFGQTVNDCFPSAIDDIADAGTALAVGLGTSCVMHLMRVAEVGLKVLAKELDVHYSISWEAYLTKIEKNIANKHSLKPAEWKRNEPFFRDVSGDLVTIKNAFRNPTMHVERTYSQQEAEQVFLAIKTLMQRMAAHFKPVQQPVLTLVESNRNSVE